MKDKKAKYCNVLIVGCGGAGLRAAIEVKLNGLSVRVLGKRLKNDSHTVLAAGGINGAFGNLDKKDSWEQHFADTYLEGYEIGDPEAIELLTKNSPERIKEVDSWGANFQKLSNNKLDQRYFGAHTFRRTCYTGDYTGEAILKALLNKAEQLKIEISDNEYVTDLLVEEKKCFGVMSINKNNGERIINIADAVILCTGGHTRIWSKSSSRTQENLGDGFYLALKAGCALVDMEMVQFHPTGMLFPESVSGTLVTEAVRGEGGLLFNNKKERFMKKYDSKRMELSARDKVAIANYTEIIEGRGTSNGGVYLDISHKDKEFIISKIPKIYNQFLEYQKLDISQSPMEVAPTAHYSMGGIEVEAKTHATSIKGLFAAGEVAGGLHGANRLGGNSLAEILVFGKIAGYYATLYSKTQKIQLKPMKSIEQAHKNLDNLFKNGDQSAHEIFNKLREVMWKNCGVLKNEKNLKKGILEIKRLKKLFEDINIKHGDNHLSIINALDLKASLINAEATLLSALARKESRGAHNRSDFKELIRKNRFNILVYYLDEDLILKKRQVYNPDNTLSQIISRTKVINNFKGRLIE